jgi:integrase
MANSTAKPRKSKPNKPYGEFPLFAHANGSWAKKIRGKLHYFGKWDDPDAALQKYLDGKDELHAGRTPRVNGDGLTVADLCNQFLTAKRHLLDTCEITDRSFRDYYATSERVVNNFGKSRIVDDLVADDFQQMRMTLAKTRGPVALGNEIGRIRMVFKFGYDNGLIEKPVRYGQSFNKPNRKTLRKAKNANGPRMFEADELRRIISECDPIMRAMVLLGANCGFGQSDIANLPISAVDLNAGWLNYPRPKTGVERRCPLWPETIGAMREAISQRPEPKSADDDGCVFITKYGNRWVRTSNNPDPAKRAAIDAVAQQFSKLLVELKINGKRNFYALRHTFETIGGESRDQVAVNSLMGHVDSSMAGVYRERISDERLQAVVETVRTWLWPNEESADGQDVGAAT